jgi:GPI inositol-deacylase, winged helix domain
MNSLAATISCRHVRTVLENLPEQVNTAYDQTMERIEGQIKCNRELARRVLSWMTYACRPLSLKELRHALAVSPNMAEMDPEALVPEMILTSVCQGLVVVDRESDTVRLVRKSLTFMASCTLLILSRLHYTGVFQNHTRITVSR